MIIGEWIIPEEYRSDDHLGNGQWEGDCVYVLAWDKENKRIYCYTGHAYAYTKRVQDRSPTIVTASSGYYNMIKEMVRFDDGYNFPPNTEKFYREFIQYTFRIKTWKSMLR